MQDEFAGGEADGAHKVLIDELVRYLSGDQLEDFCSDFERHHDLVGDMEESKSEVSDEEKEKAMHRAMHSADEPERGEKRKKVSVSKAPWEESVEVDEADVDENAFNQAAAAAARAGKDEFEFGGKTHKTTMKKDTAHQLAEGGCSCCGCSDSCGCPADCSSCDCNSSVNEAPTMDTTQMITLMRNAGLSEDKIDEKLNEWANSAAGAADEESTSYGEPYEKFAQSVNLSLKRYLDAENMKVQVSEHKVEDMKALYESKKSK